jgi:hypothetical protein
LNYSPHYPIEKGYIKYIPQTTTIYDESSSNDKIQTLVVNNSYGINKKCEISVIIPTFNNVEYIDECINSIMESSKKVSIEILVGIDGCQKTLNYVKSYVIMSKKIKRPQVE